MCANYRENIGIKGSCMLFEVSESRILTHFWLIRQKLRICRMSLQLECQSYTCCDAFEFGSEFGLHHVAWAVFEVHPETAVGNITHQSVGHFVAMQPVGFDFLALSIEAVACLE